VSFLAFTDKAGTPLPWRNCSGAHYTPPGNGQMNFDPLMVPVDPNSTDARAALRDYFDYIRQAHVAIASRRVLTAAGHEAQ